MTQGNRHSPNLGVQVNRLPTGHGFSKDRKTNGPSGNELGRAVNRMPTPTVNMVSGGANHESPSVKAGKHGINLEGAVLRCPPPTAACATGGQTSRGGERKDELLLASVAGGSLNPDWVEWLHGWPIGWTGLKPLGMDRFRQWCDLHGGYSGERNGKTEVTEADQIDQVDHSDDIDEGNDKNGR